jgi:deoxyribodipyrimidine photo-lyase
MHKVGLFWFHTDLRIADNPTLVRASQEVDRLICIYCLPPASPGNKSPNRLSDHRLQFLKESLTELDGILSQLGQQLDVIYAPALETIAQIITRHDIGAIYGSSSVDYHDNEVWQLLKKRYPMITFSQTSSSSLISPAQLPFPLDALPDSRAGVTTTTPSKRDSQPVAATVPGIQPEPESSVQRWRE